MTKIEDGGPAFPSMPPMLSADADQSGELGNIKLVRTAFDGMSLRDWFAGQALCGILASPGRLPISDDVSQTAASASYIMADAMLAASNGGQ